MMMAYGNHISACNAVRHMRIPALLFNNRYVDIGLRLMVAGVFLISGIAKLPMHSELVEAGMMYRVLPLNLVGSYLSALPWMEIAVGGGLLTGLLTRFFCVVGIAMGASFVMGNIIAIVYYNPLEQCHCFGEIARVSYLGALVIDALLIAGMALIFKQQRRFMALDLKLFGSKEATGLFNLPHPRGCGYNKVKKWLEIGQKYRSYFRNFNDKEKSKK